MSQKRFTVYEDQKLKATFEGEKADFEAFKYILNHQSQSVSWALRHGGWEIREEGGDHAD
jgi:hypothetical protein